MFYKINEAGFSMIGLYIDDILVSSNDPLEHTRVLNGLSAQFKVRDKGHVKKFLGIHVKDNEDCIAIDIHHYIENLVERFKLHILSISKRYCRFLFNIVWKIQWALRQSPLTQHCTAASSANYNLRHGQPDPTLRM